MNKPRVSDPPMNKNPGITEIEELDRCSKLKPTDPPKMLRVWKLGSLEHKITPTKAAAEKLQEKLDAWDHKSNLDLVWGPDIELIQLPVDGKTEDIEDIVTLTLDNEDKAK